MIYLTFNEAPTGIFSSQVTDVINYMNSELNADVRLYSFVSVRNFFSTRKKIRSEVRGAVVIPMLPTMRLWKLNRFTLYFFLFFAKKRKLMGRSVWATWLALKAKDRGFCTKVIYDGRGAVYHESLEYAVIGNKNLVEELKGIEELAVSRSDFRLSVSHQLVQFWNEFYSYNVNQHVIIPCTLSASHLKHEINSAFSLPEEWRDSVIGIYSGSAAGWQTADSFSNLIRSLMNNQANFRLILLSHDKEGWKNLVNEFPGRIILHSAKPNEVAGILRKADYGFLVREQSVTNKVASPVKFAEYLAAGLKVIISEQLGDFTGFVRTNDAGIVIADKEITTALLKPLSSEKERLRSLVSVFFTKQAFRDDYRKILSV